MIGFARISAEDLVAWTRDFVRYPSEQTDLMEYDPAVQAFIGDCAGPLVQKLSLTSCRDEMGNLIVRVGPPGGKLEIAFFAYAMTHPRTNMLAPFHGEIVQEDSTQKMRGRGISEQKASMAASLAAVADLAAAGGLSGSIAWVLLSAGETGRHDAIKAAIANLGEVPKCAIIAIGTGGQISLGNRGRQDIAVTVHGAACHSSRPWLGVDVTGGIREILDRANLLNQAARKHPTLGPASLTCTSIHTAPQATHTVQSEGRMTFDRRLLPDEDPNEVFANIKMSFELAPPLKVEVERGPFMFGSLIAKDSRLVRAANSATTALGFPTPSTFYALGAIDTGYLNHLGGEAMQWGAGDPAQFHTANERIGIDELVTMAESYRATAAYLLEQAS